MTLQDKINWLMGIRHEEEDQRGSAVVHFPSAVKCPVEDCEERGMYTNCYSEDDLDKCKTYLDRVYLD